MRMRFHSIFSAIAPAVFTLGAGSVLAQAPAAPPAAATPYTIGAQRNGVVKCLARMNQVTSFLTSQAPNSGVVFTSPTGGADQRLAAAVMEVQGPTAPSFVSASFAPGAAGNECSATYDAVTYWNATCQQVATANFNNFKVVTPLRQAIATLDGGPLVRVYLMAAGAGCVSIKKEILY